MQQGGKVLFREDFLNVARVLDNYGQLVGTPLINRGMSGGQAMFYSGGLAVAYAGAVTILCHAIVATSGSDQALWSVGSAAARRMEVGINATGRPYVWGSAQVLLGDVIPDGHHDIGWAVSSAGYVTCVVDGELWGSGTVVFGAATTGWRMVIGGSVLGTLPWQGTVKPVFVYRGALSQEEMASEMGVSDYFTPSQALGATGAWWTDASMTLNTQPVLVDGNMEAATTAAWSVFRDAQLTKQTGTPYEGSRVLRVGYGTLSYPGAYQNICINGNRYLVGGQMRGNGTRAPYVNFQSSAQLDGTTSTDWQSAAWEVTADGTNFTVGQSSSAAGHYVEFDAFTIGNLSVTSHAPFAATGALAGTVLAQATAANMKWRSTTLLNGHYVSQYAGTADYDASDAAAAVHAYHKAAGFTFSCLYRSMADGAASYFVYTYNGTTAQTGVMIYKGSTNRIVLSVGNGGGVASAISAAHSTALTAASGWHVISMTWSEAGGARMLIDAIAPETFATTGAVSAGDASSTLNVGYAANAMFASPFIRVGAVSDATLAQLHAWQKA
jgi:hypothetical protein